MSSGRVIRRVRWRGHGVSYAMIDEVDRVCERNESGGK